MPDDFSPLAAAIPWQKTSSIGVVIKSVLRLISNQGNRGAYKSIDALIRFLT